jgi:hypothetical protein
MKDAFWIKYRRISLNFYPHNHKLMTGSRKKQKTCHATSGYANANRQKVEINSYRNKMPIRQTVLTISWH